MLTYMQIHHFAIVESLIIDFQSGMTTITGETGAGKSIAIDALGLCLGERADPAMIRTGHQKAEIVVTFQVKANSNVHQWLVTHDLAEGDECILRRVITKEGRSRAFINGSPVPASLQKQLGQLLINIHGQHAHQRLLKNEHQLNLLDQYAGHQDLLQQMKNDYKAWQKVSQQIKLKRQEIIASAGQKQLLEYQINELNSLAIESNEFQTLEAEHQRLSQAGNIALWSTQVKAALSDNEQQNALSLIQHAKCQLVDLSEIDHRFTPLIAMLEESAIQLQEVSHEMTCYLNDLPTDSRRLDFLDSRLAQIIGLAKKHQVAPSDLYQKHQDLIQQLAQLGHADHDIQALEQIQHTQKKQALKTAEQLHQSRKQYAKKLNHLISQSLNELNMPQGQFQLKITQNTHSLSIDGFDQCEFLVSTNPGQMPRSLSKVASGGELSRISLAIQVITAQKVETPSLIFDEVDVGISGATATIVGKLLRKLGQSTQVLCVTHLPQVAGCGHHHLFVSKSIKDTITSTHMQSLTQNERIKELARLLGGSEITKHTLANAKELLIAA